MCSVYLSLHIRRSASAPKQSQPTDTKELLILYLMSKQETYISFIIDQLQSGNVSYKDVMSLFVSKWQLSERQFVRYWNIANKRHIEAQNKLQKEKDDIYIEAEKEALKNGLKSKLQRQLELQAMLEPDYMTSEIVGIANGVPVWADRPLTPMEKKHIHAELSKMDGSYAPAKVAQTDTEGNDKKTDLSTLNDDDLRRLVELQRKCRAGEA